MFVIFVCYCFFIFVLFETLTIIHFPFYFVHLFLQPHMCLCCMCVSGCAGRLTKQVSSGKITVHFSPLLELHWKYALHFVFTSPRTLLRSNGYVFAFAHIWLDSYFRKLQHYHHHMSSPKHLHSAFVGDQSSDNNI